MSEEDEKTVANGSARVESTPSAPAATNIPDVVLGKDGKPCRSCTSGAAFASWSSSMKKKPAAAPAQSSETNAASIAATRKNCPPDVEQLGNSSWTLLHTIAASYPDNPSTTQKEDLRGFMRTFSRLYPCWVCAEDFQTYIQKDETKVGSRAEFGNWLCNAHNEVNRKLGKKEFDCSRWEERWRTGWKDGSCD